MVQIRAERELRQIAPGDIEKSPRNPRGAADFDDKPLTPLLKSIRAHGVLQPIIVAPTSTGKYRLIEGERRWRVARKLGLETIPAHVIASIEAHDEVVAMYHLHMQRKKWGPTDELRAVEKLNQARDVTVPEMAEELGMSQGTLRNRLRVLHTPPQVVADVMEGRIGFTAALRAAETTDALVRARPQLVDQLGGEDAVVRRLADKARRRRGLAPELVTARPRLVDPEQTTDAMVRRYIEDPEASVDTLFVERPRPERNRGDADASTAAALSSGAAATASAQAMGLADRMADWIEEVDRFEAGDASVNELEAIKLQAARLIAAVERLERSLFDRQLATANT